MWATIVTVLETVELLEISQQK